MTLSVILTRTNVDCCVTRQDVDCSDSGVKSDNDDGPKTAALTDTSGANSTLLGAEYEYDNSTMEFDDSDGHNATHDHDDEDVSPFNEPVNF